MREEYNLRTRKVIDYKEKEEADVEEEIDATEHTKTTKEDASKDVDTPGVDETNRKPDVNCPVCWSSLVGERMSVQALGVWSPCMW